MHPANALSTNLALHFRHCHPRTKHCQCLQRKTSWRTVAVPRKANATQPPPTCHPPETDHLSPRQSRPPALIIITFKLRDTPAPKSEALSEILDLLDGPPVVLPDFLLVAHHPGSTAPKLQSVIAVPAPISKLTALNHNVQKQSVIADLGTNDSSFNTTSCTS